MLLTIYNLYIHKYLSISLYFVERMMTLHNQIIIILLWYLYRLTLLSKKKKKWNQNKKIYIYTIYLLFFKFFWGRQKRETLLFNDSFDQISILSYVFLGTTFRPVKSPTFFRYILNCNLPFFKINYFLLFIDTKDEDSSGNLNKIRMWRLPAVTCI